MTSFGLLSFVSLVLVAVLPAGAQTKRISPEITVQRKMALVASALARTCPLCCALHNGYYVERRIMVSQGLRDAGDEALMLFRG